MAGRFGEDVRYLRDRSYGCMKKIARLKKYPVLFHRLHAVGSTQTEQCLFVCLVVVVGEDEAYRDQYLLLCLESYFTYKGFVLVVVVVVVTT
jgi:hypothetical protein